MIELVCGRSGYGKTSYIYNLIKNNNNNTKKFLIVPDQMSLQTQVSLMHIINKGCLLNFEVIGFNIFMNKIFEILSVKSPKIYDIFIKKSLLQKVLLDNKNYFSLYKNQFDNSSFIDKLYSTLEDLNLNFSFYNSDKIDKLHYCYKKYSELKKIADIISLLDKDKKQILSFNNNFSYIIDLINNNEYSTALKGIDIYVDSFINYTYIQKHILVNLFNKVNTGAITFMTDIEQTDNIFQTVKNNLTYFHENIINSKLIYLNVNKRLKNNEILSVLEKRFDNPINLKDYCLEKEDRIVFNVYNSVEQEIESTCYNIRKKIFQEKLKSSNFCIYISDTKYVPLLEKYLSLYDIKYFNDIKSSMLQYPTYAYLKTLIEIYKNSLDIFTINKLVKNDFFIYRNSLDIQEINLFTDFLNINLKNLNLDVLKNDRYWKYYDLPYELNNTLNSEKTLIINNIRKKIITEIDFFIKLIDRKFVFIKDFIVEFYNIFFPIIHDYIYKNIKSRMYVCINIEFYQDELWQRLIDIVENIYEVIGNIKYDPLYIIEVLSTALEDSYFINYPSSFDGLMIGDYYRTRFQNIYQDDNTLGMKHIYLLGLSENLFPKKDDTAIISNTDFTYYHKYNLINDLQNVNFNYEKLIFYSLITSASRTVTLSYFKYNNVGDKNENLPSSLLTIFNSMWFNIKKTTYGNINCENYQYCTLKALKNIFMRDPIYNVNRNTLVYQVIKYVDFNYIKDIDILLNKDSYKYTIVDNIKINNKFSSSHIEEYNKCPYRYFINYILKLPPTYKIFKLQKFQVGNLIHYIYKKIGDYVKRNNLKFSEVKNISEITEKYFNKYIYEDLKGHPILNYEFNNFILKKLKEDIVNILCKDLCFIDSRSNFRPKFIEYEINYNLSNEDRFVGKIDRIDIDNADKFFRIIDYKSYNTKIDLSSVINGTQIQLFIYSFLTAKKLMKKWCGASYLYINDVYQTSIKKKKEMNNLMCSSGFYIDNIDYLSNYDTDIKNFEKTLLEIDFNKDGTLSKNSNVFSYKDLDEIYNFLIRNINKTIKDIKSGNFTPYPLKTQNETDSSICINCNYKDLCHFNWCNKKKYNEKYTCIINKRESFFKQKNEFLRFIKGKNKDE